MTRAAVAEVNEISRDVWSTYEAMTAAGRLPLGRMRCPRTSRSCRAVRDREATAHHR